MARKDHVAAVQLAREIADPQFRCRALAWIARFASDDEFADLAQEAISAAWACPDPYQALAASAWPLRAMIERNKADKVQAIIDRLLQLAANIAHPVNRMDAFFLVWQAILPLGRTPRSPIQETLVRTCLAAQSWKGSYTLRDVVVMVGRDDLTEAERIVSLMPESKYRRQVAHAMAVRDWHDPRSFFWESERRETPPHRAK